METDFRNLKIGIVGLGLIGGSIAKALKLRTRVFEVVAQNHNQKAIDEGIKDGIISQKSGTQMECLKECDVIFVCTPVGLIADTVKTLGTLCPNAIITDAASTKADILEAVDKMIPCVRFIGGHPMAGSEKTGYSASSPSLYENAYYVLCKGVGASQIDLMLIKNLVKSMGAIPVIMTPIEHDRAVALISHLPHLVASTLSRLAGEKDNGELSRLAAGGFRDITRIASSSPSLWFDILKSNKNMVVSALGDYINDLCEIKNAMENNDYLKVNEFLSSGKAFRDNLPDSGRGLINKFPEVWVNVEDRPGVIGEVATLLGNGGINIMNLHIQNSREYEGGVLRISINREEDIQKTKDILVLAGMDVV